jgi:D-sedoheptulose 7-phosphate isomerase
MARDDSAAVSLYPFLSSDRGDLDAVLEEVRRSTVAKAHEVMALRRAVGEREGTRLMECAREMADRFAAGGRLLAFGNGGSSTDAQDLARLFLCPGGNGRQRGAAQQAARSSVPDRVAQARALPAFALTNDIAVVTALTNDIGFDVVFARQVAAFGRPGDIAVALSTSGNSTNLLRGLDEARRRGLLTIGISGYDGGKMAELSSIDHLFVVPSSSVHRIQETQTTLYHALWELTLGVLDELEV